MEILFNERVFRSKIKNYRKLNKIILDKIDSLPSKGLTLIIMIKQ